MDIKSLILETISTNHTLRKELFKHIRYRHFIPRDTVGNPMGRLTFAFTSLIKHADIGENVLFVAPALCSPKEKIIDVKKGREIARTRLCNGLLNGHIDLATFSLEKSAGIHTKLLGSFTVQQSATLLAVGSDSTELQYIIFGKHRVLVIGPLQPAPIKNATPFNERFYIRQSDVDRACLAWLLLNNKTPRWALQRHVIKTVLDEFNFFAAKEQSDGQSNEKPTP